jgi:hypothetical protein
MTGNELEAIRRQVYTEEELKAQDIISDTALRNRETRRKIKEIELVKEINSSVSRDISKGSHFLATFRVFGEIYMLNTQKELKCQLKNLATDKYLKIAKDFKTGEYKVTFKRSDTGERVSVAYSLLKYIALNPEGFSEYIKNGGIL